jgi:hypothetical protein
MQFLEVLEINTRIPYKAICSAFNMMCRACLSLHTLLWASSHLQHSQHLYHSHMLLAHENNEHAILCPWQCSTVIIPFCHCIQHHNIIDYAQTNGMLVAIFSRFHLRNCQVERCCFNSHVQSGISFTYATKARMTNRANNAFLVFIYSFNDSKIR